MTSLQLSAVVLTYNEELNLPACLESLAGWVLELFVVDSGSTDRTVEIARQYGAHVVAHPFEGHARQWNWALRNLPFSHEWALCLDADHRVTPELREEIVELFQRKAPGGSVPAPGGDAQQGVDGFYVRRRQVFRGTWIRHGAYYPKHLLKLVRHRQAWSDENELLDFRLYIRGRTAFLRGDLIEDNQNEADLDFWLNKHVRFARLQAEEEFRRARDGVGWAVPPSLFGTPDQRTLWRKRLWYRLPLYVRPFLYFSYRYVLRWGFLDGKQGFLFHFLQGFWYRLMVDAMLDDLRRGRESAPVAQSSPAVDRLTAGSEAATGSTRRST